MSEASIEPTQLRQRAFIYMRQSSQTQVWRNRESTRRQYALADCAGSLGWSPDQVEIIDVDLGRSGASSAERTGFAGLTAEVALGQAGIVLGPHQRRLVPLAGPMRPDRHPDRGCRWHLPSAPANDRLVLGM
ncbi:MAG: recombinase family protein [Rhodospirillales bacterium]|nr:recombinase family protein [Rhodospirillales bacterium]